jgi:hypothetical protein
MCSPLARRSVDSCPGREATATALTPAACPRWRGALYDDTSEGAPKLVCLAYGPRLNSSAPLAFSHSAWALGRVHAGLSRLHAEQWGSTAALLPSALTPMQHGTLAAIVGREVRMMNDGQPFCHYSVSTSELERPALSNKPQTGLHVVCRDVHACVERWKRRAAQQTTPAQRGQPG